MLALTSKNLSHYSALMRIDRPIGTYLVMWPALWSLWLAAKGVPDLSLLLVFISGAFLMRSAGCVINDFADRRIDGHVQRTQNRPLVTAVISSAEALQLFILLCLSAAVLLLFTNTLTAGYAVLAFLLATLYPFTKRFTQLPQVILGMAFSCSIPMAFAAQTNNVPLVALALYFAVIFWVVAYDTFYAMVDREDDLKINVKSTAILFGRYDRIITALLQLFFLALLALIGYQQTLGNIYYSSLLIISGLFLYQQYLIKDRAPAACFKAFLNNNLVGLIVFIGIVADLAIITPT
ncbi:MAG: 4-hydroxybenzoate octaprenyltransferase [Cellvibrionales bacterium]|jgi:4-hydroxybenzoate polyprenyltransferase|nr:4-hydroxybenzoate octaprenyltransferase [Cellvibrionales bacterium]HCH20571.1 4-hydroxybenzoate octaprenyltransferase [Cellvibrionales bacterium]|tara:strand:+ start:11312 stop:12190 length:879 start_codon:yes stop_codon:yes gene_type:complete